MSRGRIGRGGIGEEGVPVQWGPMAEVSYFETSAIGPHCTGTELQSFNDMTNDLSDTLVQSIHGYLVLSIHVCHMADNILRFQGPKANSEPQSKWVHFAPSATCLKKFLPSSSTTSWIHWTVCNLYLAYFLLDSIFYDLLLLPNFYCGKA